MTTRDVWRYIGQWDVRHPAHLLSQWQVRSLSDCDYCGSKSFEHCTEADGSSRCSNHLERVIDAVKQSFGFYVDDDCITPKQLREAADSLIEFELSSIYRPTFADIFRELIRKQEGAQ